jgi:hypothetical protein
VRTSADFGHGGSLLRIRAIGSNNSGQHVSLLPRHVQPGKKPARGRLSRTLWTFRSCRIADTTRKAERMTVLE